MRKLKILGLFWTLALFGACATQPGGQSTNASNAASAPTPKSAAVNVPRNLKNAVRDYDLIKEDSAVVTLPNNTDILYRKDARKLTLDELGKKFEEYAGAMNAADPKEIKAVYIAADAANEYGAILRILELARRKQIETARFVVNQNESDVPLHVFDVQLPKEPRHDILIKPNPNFLLATLVEGGKYRVNMEDVTLDGLKTLLTSVFKDREARGILREGSNEVETTVHIKAPLTAKYEDVARLIDAVKETAANPIVILFEDESGVPMINSK
jgi:biopolymer transport protein ExbD